MVGRVSDKTRRFRPSQTPALRRSQTGKRRGREIQKKMPTECGGDVICGRRSWDRGRWGGRLMDQKGKDACEAGTIGGKQ